MDERRVLGGADAVGERVVDAAHAGVAVGGLDEVARLDDLLARDLWQMPGETPSVAEKSRTPVCCWNSRCRSRSISIFGENGAIAATPSA